MFGEVEVCKIDVESLKNDEDISLPHSIQS